MKMTIYLAAIFNVRALMTREIMRSKDAQCTTVFCDPGRCVSFSFRIIVGGSVESVSSLSNMA